MQAISRHTIQLTLSRALLALPLAALLPTAHAEKKYDTGASDTQIKIGHIVPYSGPVSAYGAIGRAMGAYFDKINAEGGINGRKVVFVSLDDAYNPSKTVEQARKLVEQDEVLMICGSLGTAHNMAIQKYMNAKKVPQLFVSTGAARFGDPKHFPWTMGWQPTYQAEGGIFAQHLLATKPDAKIAVLVQNDDFGRDTLKGFLDALGEKGRKMVVAQATYEVSDPTIDSQMVTLKASGADVFYNISTPKFAAQGIRKVAEMKWKPTQYLSSVSSSVTSVLKPAGFDNATGVITAAYLRDPSDTRWHDTKEYADYSAWAKKYFAGGDSSESLAALGYSQAQTIVQVLKMAGDDLTRANIMKQASNLSMSLPLLYPGIDVKTTPDDYFPIEREQLVRFNGTSYDPIGKVLGR